MVKRCLYIALLPLLLFSCKGTWSKVTTSSMEPNVKVGSAIQIAESQTYTYGDVVVIEDIFDYPIIYRIVGLPGDSIAVEDNICVLNGLKFETQFEKSTVDETNKSVNQVIEKWFNGTNLSLWINEEMLFPENANMNSIKIPRNHSFILGDYRSTSIDSRIMGPIPIEKIKGKVTEIE